MTAKWLERGIFISPIYFTICTSEEILKRLLVKMKAPPMDGLSAGYEGTTHFLESDGNHAAIVCIFDHGHSAEATYALIVHEAVHIWQHIKKLSGERNPSKEFEAYGIQGLCVQLFAEYNRQRSPKPVKKKKKD